jgi:serine acetyltransferase
LHESGTYVKCIGRHAAIGAGSVVTRDIPANCLADGNPARVVRRFVGAGVDGVAGAPDCESSLAARNQGRS